MSNLHSRPLKSSEWIRNEIRQQIEQGDWAPGAKLPSVTQLGERYGVGQSTVREALSSLKAIGLIDMRHGSGTFVSANAAKAPLHPAETSDDSWLERARSLQHLLEVRSVLDIGCARLAAKNRQDQDLSELEEILTCMREALGDESASEHWDAAFHERIAQTTHNPALVQFQASLSQQLRDTMKDSRALWFYSVRANAEQLLEEHRAIFEAISSGNEEIAVSLTEQHLTKWRKS